MTASFSGFAAFSGSPNCLTIRGLRPTLPGWSTRQALNAILRPALRAMATRAVIDGLEALKVPVGPVQTLDQVFASDQVSARDMQIAMQAQPGAVDLIGNPLKLSRTPVTYRTAPPVFGADTQSVLDAENPFED